MRNRSPLFVVVRKMYEEASHIFRDSDLIDMQVIGCYRTLEAAENKRDEYIQQREDGKVPQEFNFEVQYGMYYDE